MRLSAPVHLCVQSRRATITGKDWLIEGEYPIRTIPGQHVSQTNVPPSTDLFSYQAGWVLQEITNHTPISFALRLTDGRTLRFVGEASQFFASLGQDQLSRPHWQVAIRMFAHAMSEPTYLKAATMSLQTALLLDGLLHSELQN